MPSAAQRARSLRIITISILGAGLLGFAANAQGQSQSARVETRAESGGVELTLNEINTDGYPDVAVFATVLKDGEPLTGLGADDFRISEDEVEQGPLTVEAQLPPLSVVVTVDVSGSMAQRMDATREAATSFVEQLDESDAVQIVSFQREIATLTTMSTTRDNAIQAIGGMVARGDTALYDGLITSLDLVAERPGRKAVVLLSDGIDNDGTGKPLSTATVAEALARAAEINVPVFVIGLGTEMDEAILQEIANATGGQYLPAPDTGQLAAVYDSIGAQLSGQYAIRYTSSLPADGTPRRVDIEVAGLRASKSYTAPGSRTSAAPALVQPREDGCVAEDAMRAEVPDLDQAIDRYNRDLISAVDLRSVRLRAGERIMAALEDTPPTTSDCIYSTLETAKALYDDDRITAVALRSFRGPLIAELSGLCTSDGRDLAFLEDCIVFYKRTYDADLIMSTSHRALVQDAADPYLSALRDMNDVDAALERLNHLADIDALNSVLERQLRTELLKGE